MNTTLYFLRSSEQKIVTDMVRYTQRLDTLNRSLEDYPSLRIYEEFYGFTSKDLGLYALLDNTLVGAAWIRRLNSDHGSSAYINDTTPVLNIAVLPEFRRQGIGSMMLEQLCIEASALYSAISVNSSTPISKAFLEKHRFCVVAGSNALSGIDGSESITMLRVLEQQEIKHPTDGYDPRKWMD